MNNEKKLLVIGSLPPPSNGPNIATEKIINASKIQKSLNIIFLDISDHRDPKNIGKLDFRNIFLAFLHISKLLIYHLFYRPTLVYMIISDGVWGYLRDLGLLLISIIFKKKVIFHLRGSEFDQFFKTLPGVIQIISKWAFKRASGAIVLGNCLKGIFGDLIDSNKIFVVPNGINYKEYDLIEDFSNNHKISGFRVLFLSSLRKRKGIFPFIKAIPFVLKKHPDIKITIAGGWRLMDEKIEAIKFIERNKLKDVIHFTGEISGLSKRKLYKEHDIFVFPPIQPEGMPWVILEAMSAKLPVISTNQGTIADVVVNDKTGYIVEPDPVHIAEKMNYLIENPSIAKKMGDQGRQRIECFFSETAYLDRLQNIFELAIDNALPIRVKKELI
jgi:glycosyltransferase involved in cell wall biosynthesis